MFKEIFFLGHTISWYYLFIAIAILIIIIFLFHSNNRRSLLIVPFKERVLLLMAVYIVSILGARTFAAVERTLSNYIVGNHVSFTELFLSTELYGHWYGSLVFIILLLIGFSISIPFKKIGRIADLIMLAVCLGIVFGKLGCFLDGHRGCHGFTTNLPWGIRYPYGDANTFFPVHPIQLYDSLFHLILFALLFKMDQKDLKFGTIGLLFVFLTSIYNISIEQLKVNPALFFQLSFAQLIYLFLLVFSLFSLFLLLKRKDIKKQY